MTRNLRGQHSAKVMSSHQRPPSKATCATSPMSSAIVPICACAKSSPRTCRAPARRLNSSNFIRPWRLRPATLTYSKFTRRSAAMPGSARSTHCRQGNAVRAMYSLSHPLSTASTDSARPVKVRTALMKTSICHRSNVR